MRITIEPSAGAELWDILPHKVVIDTPSDEHDLSEMLELLAMALRGYGFSVRNLQEAEDETVDQVD